MRAYRKVHVVCPAAIVRLAEGLGVLPFPRMAVPAFSNTCCLRRSCDRRLVATPSLPCGRRDAVRQDADAGPASLASGHGLSNARDLSQVQQIVSGVELAEMAETLVAALDVDADAREIVLRCA